jgi:hypothetical protein
MTDEFGRYLGHCGHLHGRPNGPDRAFMTQTGGQPVRNSALQRALLGVADHTSHGPLAPGGNR